MIVCMLVEVALLHFISMDHNGCKHMICVVYNKLITSLEIVGVKSNRKIMINKLSRMGGFQYHKPRHLRQGMQHLAIFKRKE